MAKIYTVTDPKGVLVNGDRIAKGKELKGASPALVKAFLRFDQIKEVKAKGDDKQPEPPKQPAPPADPAAGDEGSDKGEDKQPELSYGELKEALTELGVKFKGNTPKVELQKLYDEATAEA